MVCYRHRDPKRTTPAMTHDVTTSMRFTWHEHFPSFEYRFLICKKNHDDYILEYYFDDHVNVSHRIEYVSLRYIDSA